ncbi:MAG: hypothetical protein R2741_02125 [Methanolobus sp.]
MKKLVLSTIMAMILMFSAYAVAGENDDSTLSSVSTEDGIAGNMRTHMQQMSAVASQQFYSSNMAQRLGFGQNQNQMQNPQNMQTPQNYQDMQNMQNMQDMRSQDAMTTTPSNMPSRNAQMAPVPRMQQEMTDREEFMDYLQESTLSITDVSELREYVTPYADAVQDYLDDEDLDDAEEIYETAVSWIWVSDSTLNGQQEAWLTPTEFLRKLRTMIQILFPVRS